MPFFIYDDIPWVPYNSTNMSVDSFGFLGRHQHDLEEKVYAAMTMNDTVFQSKLQKLAEVRYYYTYEGVIDQIKQFLQDPFGDHGGYLRCYGK